MVFTDNQLNTFIYFFFRKEISYQLFSKLSCECYIYDIIIQSSLGSFLDWYFLSVLLRLLKGTKYEYTSGDFGKKENNGKVSFGWNKFNF